MLDFRDNPLNLSVREAFVLEDAAQLTIGTLLIRQGSESDQPTAGATGSPVAGRLGIYKDHKGVPGSLVVDAGEVDVTTVAAVEATINKTLFGRYWLVVIFESASSLQITLQSSASTNVGEYGAEGPTGGANVLRPTVTYGPLPSTYPTVTSADFDTANIPRIWLRAGG